MGSGPSRGERERLRAAPARGAGDGLAGHRNREGEPRALARPAALGPDAAPVGLHQPLRDGQAQAGPPDPALPFLAPGTAVLPEQVRQPVGRHAPAFVGDRDRHVQAIPHRGDPDGGRLGRVP